MTIYKVPYHVHEVTTRVHAMNAQQHQTAADPWTKSTDLSHWLASRQLRNYIHHCHHYYSARKLILIALNLSLDIIRRSKRKKFAIFSDSLSSLLAINNRHLETGYVQSRNLSQITVIYQTLEKPLF